MNGISDLVSSHHAAKCAQKRVLTVYFVGAVIQNRLIGRVAELVIRMFPPPAHTEFLPYGS